MTNQDQLLDALNTQQLAHKKVNRILYIAIPIVSFLVCVICANMSWQSTLGTFIMLVVSFLAVGIKRWSIFMWMFFIALYCTADNLFTYGTIATRPLEMQMATMIVFLILLHMARPYLDRLMADNLKKK